MICLSCKGTFPCIIALLVDSLVTRAGFPITGHWRAGIPTSNLVALINVSEPQQRGHRNVFHDLKSHVVESLPIGELHNAQSCGSRIGKVGRRLACSWRSVIGPAFYQEKFPITLMISLRCLYQPSNNPAPLRIYGCDSDSVFNVLLKC